MPRVKSNVARLKRKNKVMKLAKGYWGGRSKLWKAAKEATERAAKYAYRDRRSKKVEFRRLWITRINAAARLHALSYNRLMNGLRKAGVEINRKILADVALTMPGRRQWRGGLHLVTQVVDEICDVFRELGFTRVVGPEAETERYNFYALNFPKDHPALDAQDSFYLGGDVLLRTHTSPVQIRTLERYPPPIRIVVPGRCYRRDPFDASHSPVFEQIEGFAVDEGITFVDFKATLATFARRIFAPTNKVRFRPSYFPFTEPSAEMDVQCQICGGSG